MKNIYYLIVLSGAFIFCACEKEMIQPDTQHEDISTLKKAKKHTVPFKATFVQSQTSEDFSNFPEVDLIMEGEGSASHLGKTTLLVAQHWNWFAGEGPGKVEFTAANGDILEADLDAFLKVEEFDDLGNPVIVKVWGTGEFTGGTGRFEDASGDYSLNAEHNIPLNQGTAFYKGRILY